MLLVRLEYVELRPPSKRLDRAVKLREFELSLSYSAFIRLCTLDCRVNLFTDDCFRAVTTRAMTRHCAVYTLYSEARADSLDPGGKEGSWRQRHDSSANSSTGHTCKYRVVKSGVKSATIAIQILALLPNHHQIRTRHSTPHRVKFAPSQSDFFP